MATILFDGVAYGMLLFVLACGLSVTLGLMNFVNLAHGVFAMLGGYVTALLMSRHGVPFLATLPIALRDAAGAVVGHSTPARLSTTSTPIGTPSSHRTTFFIAIPSHGGRRPPSPQALQESYPGRRYSAFSQYSPTSDAPKLSCGSRRTSTKPSSR